MMAALSRRRVLVWCLAVGLAASGALLATRLPSGIYPEVEFPRIVVVARGGAAPPDVTQALLTRPLETALATVLGVERIRSRTIRGATEIGLQLAPGTDTWRALQLVEARIGEARAGLPANTEVVAERLTTTSFPIVTFNLTGHIDPRRLRDLGELALKPALSRVRGVGRVEVLGGDVREIEVVLDPARTAALGLSPSKIADLIQSATPVAAVGRFDDAHALVTVTATGEPRDLAGVAALPIGLGPGGAPIPLSAVASVEEGAEDRLLRVAGPGGETVLVSVSRLPGTSTPEVVERVQAAVAQTVSTFPAGVTVTPVYDQAVLVNEALRSVRDAILIGMGLCVAVIALFLRDLRAGLAAAVAVPITLGITFLPLGILHQSLNVMSLGGLAVAIGLVIDDAIVVVEAIKRRWEQGQSPSVAVADGVRELLAALVGTTATTVVVFLPLAWLEGLVGDFFAALATTLAGAVLLSLAVSLTVVPLAAAAWMKPLPDKHPEGLPAGPAKPGTAAAASPAPRTTRGYAAVVRLMLAKRWIAPLAYLAFLAAGVFSARSVATGFLPSMDEGAFVLDYFMPAGTSLADTDAVAQKIEGVLRGLPEVATYARRTGAELGPAAATEVSRGDIMVRLKPLRERHRSAEAVIEEARSQVAREAPQARVEFVQVLQDILNDLSGAPRPIEVKIFGNDYVALRAHASEMARGLRTVPGLVDLYQGFEGDAPELRFRLDAGRALRLKSTAGEVARDLEASLKGVIAGTLLRPDRPIHIRVRYPDAVRFDPAALANLPVVASPGQVTSVQALATAERAASPSTLVRENLRPVVILTADHEGRDLGSVASDVESAAARVPLPEGYARDTGGQYKAQQETFRALFRVLGFGLLAVFVVLLAQFRRARLAIVVLAAVPLAVVGALVTLVLTGVPLNASSLMGCTLLVGLVVKNGILLLERAEALWDAGASLEEALVEAGTVRLRPILMTTLATVAGLAPLALGLGAGAEIQRPLAVAVIGGLLSSAVASLLLMPALVGLVFKRTPGSSPRGGNPAPDQLLSAKG